MAIKLFLQFLFLFVHVVALGGVDRMVKGE